MAVMYTVSVEAQFSAVHQLRLSDGTLEPVHGHDWTVRAYYRGLELNDAGLLVDFEDARSALGAVLAGLHHTDLNRNEVLGGQNPTAEVVSRHIFEELRSAGGSLVCRVDVTEAPGCTASFERPAGA